MYKLRIYIEGQEVELFDDETVTLSSSVKNVNDITKVFTDYSQSFTVPASPKNNRIFKHWWNVDIDGGFDARVLIGATLEINYLPFKNGSIRLEGVDIDFNKPIQYRIQFFGLLTSLKNTFKDDYLSVLDLSAYDHIYNYANVATGLTTSLLGGDGSIKYPLISSKKRWYYNSDTADDTNTDTLVNIAYEAGTNKGIKWNELKPCIKVKKIIDEIESHYGITFTNDFIDSGVLDDLYLWMSKDKGNLSVNNDTNLQLIDFNATTSGYLNLGTDLWTGDVYTPNTTDEYNRKIWAYSLTITPNTGFETVQYNAYIKDNVLPGRTIEQKTNVSGTQTLSGNVNPLVLDNLEHFIIGFYVSSGDNFEFTASLQIDYDQWEQDAFHTWSLVSYTENYTAGTNVLTGELNSSYTLPKMKVVDFINGLIKMYNQAVIPNSPTNFYLDTLDNWYSNGKVYDITKYVDYTNKIPVDRVPIPSSLNFKFQEAQTFLAYSFKEQNDSNFGDISLTFSDDNGKVFDGGSFDIELPFEQMMYERLSDENDNSQTEIQVGYAVDKKQEEVLIKPHLFYLINVDCSSTPFALLSNSGTPTQINNAFMPFHGNLKTSPDYTTLFDAELNEWDGISMTNSLYSLYYANYIMDMYNVKRRIYKFNAKLPLALLIKLQLNDKLIIRDKAFIINEIERNLTTGDVKLELINYLGTITGTDTDIYFEYEFGTNTGENYVIDGTDIEPITTTADNEYFEYDL